MVKRKKKDFFDKAYDVGKGTATLGVTTAVTAGVVAQAPAGVNVGGLTQGLNVAAGFVPIATTAYLGSEVIGLAKNLQPKKKRMKRK